MAEPISMTARPIKSGIGHVRIAFFPGVNGQRFARELDRALATVQDCARLIFDLRGNLGGFVGSLRLMSYLTPNRVPVGHSLTRKGEDRKWRPDQLACIDRLPATRLDTLKMAVRFLILHRDRSIRLVTEGLGAKPFHGRVVMLVNEHTLSAGEMVAVREGEQPREDCRHANRRPGISQHDTTSFSLERGIEHERVTAILACHMRLTFGRRDLPAAMLRPTEQGRKARARIKTREAQPVD